MKKFYWLMIAGLAVASNAPAETLVWNTTFTNWTDAGVWTTTDAVPVPATWTNGDTANFPSVGGIENVNLGSGTVTAADINVASSGTTPTRIIANEANSQLVVQGTADLQGRLHLVRASAAAPAEQFTFTGAGVIGAGQLTLRKEAAGDMLVGLTGTNTSVNPSGGTVNISGTSAGLVGFYGAGTNNSIGRDFVVTGGVTAYLGATTGATVAYSGDVTGAGAAVTQINSGAYGHDGLVRLDTGASLLTSTVVVDTGTLMINGGDIGDTTALVLDGGTLAMGNAGYSETIGTLTVSAGSVIDFGNGGSTLFFSASDVNTWGGVLQIWNYNPNIDHLYIGEDDSGMGGGPGVYLDATQLGPNTTVTDYIVFYSDNGQTQILTNGGYIAGTGEVVPVGDIMPVPEPAAVMSVLLLVGVVFWRERSFFTRVRRSSLQPLRPTFA
jgi:hypothetical protein